MHKAETITEEIRRAIDIVDVIGREVTLKRAGKDFRGLCPFHKEKTPSFHVKPQEQYFKCFGCGAGGDVFKFIQMQHGLSFPEAKRMLADRAGIKLESTTQIERGGPKRLDILRINRWAANVYREHLRGPAGAVAAEYLKNRRISDEMIQAFELGYAPESFDFLLRAAQKKGISSDWLLAAGLVKPRQAGGVYDTFRYRVMFPILDPSGQVLGFGGRCLGDDPAKYLNSPETLVFNKSRCLYGLHRSRDGFVRSDRAILMEGYTDVIMAHQHGFSESVATLGTAMTDQHGEILRRYVPNAILVFDADEAGQRAADRGLEIAMGAQLEVFLVRLSDGMDPCDYFCTHSAEEFETLLKSALPALEFKWHSMVQAHRLASSTAGRRSAVSEFVSWVARSAAFGKLNAIDRGIIINQLSHLLGVSRDEVHRFVSQATRNAVTTSSESARHGATSATVTHSTRAIRPRLAREAIMWEVLAVVLCQPELYADAAELFEGEFEGDPLLMRIRQAVKKLVAETAALRTQTLLEYLEDPSDAARVIQLLEDGRDTGQLSERLQLARHRWRILQSGDSASQMVQDYVGSLHPTEMDGCSEDPNLKLSELFERTREYASGSNFAGIRKLHTDARSVSKETTTS